jgi:hypothetical protein
MKLMMENKTTETLNTATIRQMCFKFKEYKELSSIKSIINKEK